MGQVRVTALSIGEQPVPVTREVRHFPFAESSEGLMVEVDMALEPGDLLSSASAEAVVELDCRGAIVVLSGRFRVLIDTAEDDGCVLDLLSGALHVLADSPTEVNFGGAVLGTEGTAYAVWLTRSPQGADSAICVYDGEATLRTEGVAVSVGAQQYVKLLPQAEPTVSSVTDRQIVRSAEAFARADLARQVPVLAEPARPPRPAPTPPPPPEPHSGEENRPAYTDLTRLHYAVLKAPDDKARRVELAKAQIALGENDKAVYQLRRADVADEESLEHYQIDPRVLNRNLSNRNRDYLRRRVPNIDRE